MTRTGIADATPEVRTTVSASAKRRGSADGRSRSDDGRDRRRTGPCTSEIAQVTDCPATAASRPPLIPDRCFRTQLSSAIGTPAFISARAYRSCPQSDSPAAGAASNDDGLQTTGRPAPARPISLPASRSARRPPLRSRRSATDARASNHSRWRGCSLADVAGDDTRAATPARSARQTAASHRPRGLAAATTRSAI